MTDVSADFAGLRPPTFDSREENWTVWSYKMRAYLSITSPAADDLVQAAEGADTVKSQQ